jgi:NADPH-dependent curcumin reductase CurA
MGELQMPQTPETNRRIVLAARPTGMPDKTRLRLENTPTPRADAGQMLLRTMYLSLDPYMRGRMNDTKSYAEPVKSGEVMTGQVVTEVVRSEAERSQAGRDRDCRGSLGAGGRHRWTDRAPAWGAGLSALLAVQRNAPT